MPQGILLDADIPPAVGAALRRLGHDVVDASGNPELEAFDDATLLGEAMQQGRVLVTYNIRDFLEAARTLAHEQKDHTGIILIHSRSYPRTNIGAIARALDGLLETRDSCTNSILYLP